MPDQGTAQQSESMNTREKVSEWWELWCEVPDRDPVRTDRYGVAVDVRVPREGFPTLDAALLAKEARGNRFDRIVHVVRYRRTRCLTETGTR